jgi:uroporphyrin-III C-methyltransferase/precorrin-2 dehydrogenase/sirohydrochlorin ferrochelatase/uroporphyrin-III C-methyltransferase
LENPGKERIAVKSGLVTGRVVIIGAGPGDPELLTIKAVRHLAKADVVLTDRLASTRIVEEYAPQAVMIPVGKQCRRSKSTPQFTINQLMVQHAQAGRYVVRLKGGDISVFSNIHDELEALVEAGIPYELVPGITAALGTAAAAGIPLTARGLSRGLRLLTYYNEEAISTSEWQSLAHTADTLVFYMSGETCFALAKKLMEEGKPADTPVFLAEQATTPLQQFQLNTLGKCSREWAGHKFLSPALLIIGEVARLYEKYQWTLNHQTHQEFFAPITHIPQVPPIRKNTLTTT